MDKEDFRKCADYIETGLSDTHFPLEAINIFRAKIANIRGLLDAQVFEVYRVSFEMDAIKRELYTLLLGKRCKITKGDITEEKVDAIVNAANTSLILGGGVAWAIRRKGGPKVQLECDKITNGKTIGRGAVAVTGGGNLSPQIIHAAVMHWGGNASAYSIKVATGNIIIEAKSRGFKTLAIPALGAGADGVTAVESAEAILAGLLDRVMDLGDFDEIRIVTYDNNTQNAFARVFSL